VGIVSVFQKTLVTTILPDPTYVIVPPTTAEVSVIFVISEAIRAGTSSFSQDWNIKTKRMAPEILKIYFWGLYI
jgi:hypothetical protein